MSSGRVGIFVATVTGTAEICAEEISAALEQFDLAAEIRLMDAVHSDALKEYDAVVIVSSTYGHGDIPDNGQALLEAIEAADSHVGLRFAVFGLGDRTFAATFCEAGRRWDTLLAEKGGSRLAPLLQHDAASNTLAEDEAGAWATDWAAQLTQAV